MLEKNLYVEKYLLHAEKTYTEKKKIHALKKKSPKCWKTNTPIHQEKQKKAHTHTEKKNLYSIYNGKKKLQPLKKPLKIMCTLKKKITH